MKLFFEYARTVMSLRNVPFPVSMTEKFHRSKKAIYEMMAQFLNGATTDYTEGRLIYEKCKGIIADFELTKDLSNETIFQEVFRFTGNARTFYHDCICLSAYDAYFAQLLGMNTEKRESAAIAGLLHNIGISQMSANSAEKDFSEMTPEEQAQYVLYPERSVNMVKSKKVPISPEISDGIGQHRENTKGTGFPKKLLADSLSEMGKLMAISYRFLELTSLREGHQALQPQIAISKMRDEVLSGDGNLDLLMVTKIFGKYKV